MKHTTEKLAVNGRPFFQGEIIADLKASVVISDFKKFLVGPDQFKVFRPYFQIVQHGWPHFIIVNAFEKKRCLPSKMIMQPAWPIQVH